MKKPVVLVQKDCVDGPCHNAHIIKDLEKRLKKVTKERDALLAWEKSIPVDDIKHCAGWARNEGDDEPAYEVEEWLEKRPRTAETKP